MAKLTGEVPSVKRAVSVAAKVGLGALTLGLSTAGVAAARTLTPAAKIKSELVHRQPVAEDPNTGVFWLDTRGVSEHTTDPAIIPDAAEPGGVDYFALEQPHKGRFASLKTIDVVRINPAGNAFETEQEFWGPGDGLTSTTSHVIVGLDAHGVPVASHGIRLTDGSIQHASVGFTEAGAPDPSAVGLIDYPAAPSVRP
jgi:hypothetical protein